MALSEHEISEFGLQQKGFKLSIKLARKQPGMTNTGNFKVLLPGDLRYKNSAQVLCQVEGLLG